jgi:hypothetical protein
MVQIIIMFRIFKLIQISYIFRLKKHSSLKKSNILKRDYLKNQANNQKNRQKTNRIGEKPGRKAYQAIWAWPKSHQRVCGARRFAPTWLA